MQMVAHIWYCRTNPDPHGRSRCNEAELEAALAQLASGRGLEDWAGPRLEAGVESCKALSSVGWVSGRARAPSLSDRGGE